MFNHALKYSQSAFELMVITAIAFALLSFSIAAHAQSDSPTQSSDAISDVKAEPEIIVTARKRGTTVKIDRIVYDIEARDDGASLNAIDVLKKLPGISVDPSKRIIFRGGANVGFLVDGKSARRDVALAIPASQIERVELLTNPSAEYDSDSDALINLVLKKGADVGWSGSASGKLDTLGGYRTGVNFNYGGSKWAFNSSLSARVDPEPGSTFRRTDYNELQEESFTSQVFDVLEDSTFRQISAQAKLTRKISDHDSLSFLLGTNINKNPKNDIGSRVLIGSGFFEARPYTRIVRFDGFYPYGSVTFESDKKDNRYVKASVEAYFGSSDEYRQIEEIRKLLLRDGLKFSFIEGNLEFKKYFTSSQILTVGSTLSYNDVNDKLALSGFSGAGQSQSTDYGFRRQFYAAYLTYEAQLLGVTIRPGLRLELIRQDINNEFGSIAGDNRSRFILPSLHLSRQINKRNSLNASFTLRAEKPDALNFNPFLKFIAPFQAETGNPFLKPSTKLQFEFSHNYQGAGINLNQTLYYRDTRDAFNNFTVLGSNGVIITSFTNLGSLVSYGYSANIKKEFGKKLTVNYDIDIFRKKFLNRIGSAQFSDIDYTAFNSSVNLDYVLDKRNSFSAKIGYIGRTFDLSIKNPETWTFDLQYMHSFKGNLSLTVNVINLGIKETVTSRFFGPSFNGFERLRRNSRLLRVGISRTF